MTTHTRPTAAGGALKSLGGLVPLALATAVGLGAIWLFLDRGSAGGQWLLAGLLLGHALIHVLFVVPVPASTGGRGGVAWPFDLARSWVVRIGAPLSAVRMLAVALIAITVVASMLAALATLNVLVPGEWWAFLVAAAAVSSAALLALVFNLTLVIGLAVDLFLLWVAFIGDWRPPIG